EQVARLSPRALTAGAIVTIKWHFYPAPQENRMRRALALALVAAALFSAVPASLAAAHGPSAYRKTAGGYTMPGGASLGSAASYALKPAVTDTARATEDSVTIAVKDSGASVVALNVTVTPAGGSPTTKTLICNNGRIAVRQGTTVSATPVAGVCPDGRASLPRAGQVELVFHRYLPLPVARRGGAPASLRYALLIGVRDYGGSTHSTIGGAGDIRAIRAALLGAGWSDSHIKVVQDAQATATGIRDGIAWLAARSSHRTFSLMHFSGHVCIASRGPCDSGHTYLWSYDNKFIPETEVVSRMNQVQGYQWMDVAGCESGAFDAGYHSSTRLFTASSRGSETSYEEPNWNESVWTGFTWDRAFNQGLADVNGRRMKATINQMAAYGVREAAAYTRNQNAGAQHPVFAGGSGSWSLNAPPGG
ncbi:MAG: caspase family protein, partial [Frankiales bacterium]|nr:caspase family protein [Frankiales bacterium]